MVIHYTSRLLIHRCRYISIWMSNSYVPICIWGKWKTALSPPVPSQTGQTTKIETWYPGANESCCKWFSSFLSWKLKCCSKFLIKSDKPHEINFPEVSPLFQRKLSQGRSFLLPAQFCGFKNFPLWGIMYLIIFLYLPIKEMNFRSRLKLRDIGCFVLLLRTYYVSGCLQYVCICLQY